MIVIVFKSREYIHRFFALFMCGGGAVVANAAWGTETESSSLARMQLQFCSIYIFLIPGDQLILSILSEVNYENFSRPITLSVNYDSPRHS